MEKGQQIFLWLTQHSPETKTKTIILGLAKQCQIFHLIPCEAQCVKSISAHIWSVGYRRFIGEPIFVLKGDDKDDGSISSCGWGEQCLDHLSRQQNCVSLV